MKDAFHLFNSELEPSTGESAHSGGSICREPATLDDIPVVTEFLEEQLEMLECPMRTVLQLSVALDEVYSNIVKYGYADHTGPVTVSVIPGADGRSVRVQFADRGIPYDPLEKADPDITQSAEERQIGGLGIFVVKKTMDGVSYRFEEGQNILTLLKYY